MKDLEKMSLEEIIDDINKMYDETHVSFVCNSAITYKYKNQCVKIILAETENDLD